MNFEKFTLFKSFKEKTASFIDSFHPPKKNSASSLIQIELRVFYFSKDL